MISRDVRGGCVDVLVVHCCDDIAVLVQSLTSCGAAIPSLLLDPPPCVCVCGCVSQGRDAMHWARSEGFGPEVEVRPTAVAGMLLP